MDPQAELGSALTPEITAWERLLGGDPLARAPKSAGIDRNYFSKSDLAAMSEMGLIPLENSRLGTGAFGEVRLVRDSAGNERAVKILTADEPTFGRRGDTVFELPGEAALRGRIELARLRRELTPAADDAVVQSYGTLEMGTIDNMPRQAVVMKRLVPVYERPDLVQADAEFIIGQLNQAAGEGRAVARLDMLADEMPIPADIRHLAAGLDDLHRAGFFPVDLKIDNVMIDPSRPAGRQLTVVDIGNWGSRVKK